jgi:hypothetical protein
LADFGRADPLNNAITTMSPGQLRNSDAVVALLESVNAREMERKGTTPEAKKPLMSSWDEARLRSEGRFDPTTGEEAQRPDMSAIQERGQMEKNLRDQNLKDDRITKSKEILSRAFNAQPTTARERQFVEAADKTYGQGRTFEQALQSGQDRYDKDKAAFDAATKRTEDIERGKNILHQAILGKEVSDEDKALLKGINGKDFEETLSNYKKKLASTPDGQKRLASMERTKGTVASITSEINWKKTQRQGIEDKKAFLRSQLEEQLRRNNKSLGVS